MCPLGRPRLRLPIQRHRCRVPYPRHPSAMDGRRESSRNQLGNKSSPTALDRCRRLASLEPNAATPTMPFRPSSSPQFPAAAPTGPGPHTGRHLAASRPSRQPPKSPATTHSECSSSTKPCSEFKLSSLGRFTKVSRGIYAAESDQSPRTQNGIPSCYFVQDRMRRCIRLARPPSRVAVSAPRPCLLCLPT